MDKTPGTFDDFSSYSDDRGNSGNLKLNFNKKNELSKIRTHFYPRYGHMYIMRDTKI